MIQFCHKLTQKSAYSYSAVMFSSCIPPLKIPFVKRSKWNDMLREFSAPETIYAKAQELWIFAWIDSFECFVYYVDLAKANVTESMFCFCPSGLNHYLLWAAFLGICRRRKYFWRRCPMLDQSSREGQPKYWNSVRTGDLKNKQN